MANVYATKSGLWSDTTVWNTGALPTTADDVYTNTFTVTANTNTKVANIRNSSAAGITAGGSFWLANGVSLSANVVGSTSPYTLTLLPAASSVVIGNVSGGATSANSDLPAISLSGTNYLYLSGNITTAGFNTVGIRLYNTSSMSMVGNVNAVSLLGRGIVHTSTNYAYVTGNLTAGTGNPVMMAVDGSKINIVGNLTGGSAGARAIQSSTILGAAINGVTVIVKGNVTGGSGSWGIEASNGQTTEITGNVYGGSGAFGITQSTGSIKILGNLYGSAYSAIGIGTSTTMITGDCFASNLGGNAVNGTGNTTTIYGNIVNANKGIQAIYAPGYRVFPTGVPQYTRHAVNGYNSYVDYWTSNSTFSYPASSDVVLNTTYSNSTLSGSMAVPSPSSVALGAPVGTTTGTASPLTIDGILNQPIANLTTPNSIGARLKNITTSQALSAIVDSLEL